MKLKPKKSPDDYACMIKNIDNYLGYLAFAIIYLTSGTYNRDQKMKNLGNKVLEDL